MNGQRALRPLELSIPLKAGTKFEAMADPDADDGQGLIFIDIERVWDFKIRLTVEDYGTLGKLIDALTKAQEAELGRIKASTRGPKTAPRIKSEPEVRRERRERRRRKTK